jgi:hypothetical protein
MHGEPIFVVHCHCNSCRRSTGAPVTTFVGYLQGQVRFTAADRQFYASSPGVRRGFCRDCGTPLTYEAEPSGDEVHFYVSTLDRPENFVPQAHVFCGDKITWCELLDDLPRYNEARDGAEPFSHGPPGTDD